MPYRNLNELEYDILITENNTIHDEKLPDRIQQAINTIQETDTKITLSWILQILKRNNEINHWNQAYHHWIALRTTFGKNTQDDEKNITSADFIKTFNNIDQIEKLERGKQIQEHILLIAEAIQQIEIHKNNLNEVLALVCIVKGLSLRFHHLDEGKMNGIVTNWLVYCMTKIITSQTGKNRADNFQPILEAIEKLVNNSIIIRRMIPKNIIPKKNMKKKFVRFEEKQNPYPQDEKFDLKKAIIQSTKINVDIKNAKDDLIEKMIHYEEERKKLNELKKIEEEIYLSLENERVIPFNEMYVKKLLLSEKDKLNWENYAYQQEYYYYHFIVTIFKKIMGYYESPHEIMGPLLEIIQKENQKIKKEYSIVRQANEEYQRLQSIKSKLNSDIKATKMALKLKKSSTKDNIDEIEIVHPNIVDFEKKENNPNPSLKPKKSKKWLYYSLRALKLLLGMSAGILTGLLVGSIIGSTVGAGIANIISIPFCMLIGGIAGFLVAALYIHSEVHTKSRISSREYKDSKSSTSPPQNIYKKLRIQPKIQREPSTTLHEEKTRTIDLHLDHKHFKPHIQNITVPSKSSKI